MAEKLTVVLDRSLKANGVQLTSKELVAVSADIALFVESLSSSPPKVEAVAAPSLVSPPPPPGSVK